jgi:hypothetical protein
MKLLRKNSRTPTSNYSPCQKKKCALWNQELSSLCRRYDKIYKEKCCTSFELVNVTQASYDMCSVTDSPLQKRTGNSSFRLKHPPTITLVEDKNSQLQISSVTDHFSFKHIYGYKNLFSHRLGSLRCSDMNSEITDLYKSLMRDQLKEFYHYKAQKTMEI